MSYSTGQKDKILAFFSIHRDKAFTLDEVIAAIDGARQSTVYRLVPKMVEEGLLMRVHSERGHAYRYSDPDSCPHHMHVECVLCGSMCHLDEETSRKIRRIIEEKTGYSVSLSSLIRGVCPECAK